MILMYFQAGFERNIHRSMRLGRLPNGERHLELDKRLQDRRDGQSRPHGAAVGRCEREFRGRRGIVEQDRQSEAARGSSIGHLHRSHTNSRAHFEKPAVQDIQRQETTQWRVGLVLADAKLGRCSILARHHAHHARRSVQPHRDRANALAQRRSHLETTRLQLQMHRVSQQVQVRLAATRTVASQRLQRSQFSLSLCLLSLVSIDTSSYISLSLF